MTQRAAIAPFVPILNSGTGPSSATATRIDDGRLLIWLGDPVDLP